MKRVQLAMIGLVATATVLTACSSGGTDKAATATSSAAVAATTTSATAPALPTAADLNVVLGKATDPTVPQEEKLATVQGGELAPELFDVLAASQAESGAVFTVVDPIFPGYTPDSVLATVKFTVPEQPEQSADNVEFVFENGTWKLSQAWACTLISNVVTPEQVPAMCQANAPVSDQVAGEAVAPAEAAVPAEAPAEQPAG